MGIIHATIKRATIAAQRDMVKLDAAQAKALQQIYLKAAGRHAGCR